MGLSSLQHKLTFVLAHMKSPIRRVLGAALQRVLSQGRDTFKLPDAIVEKLELDLLYALARHRQWINLSIFQDVMTDFVATDYRLARPVASEIVTAMIEETVTCTRTTLVADHDESRLKFLRYVFVEAASAKSEESLVDDLGLGVGLLRRIRAAAEAVVAANGKDSDTANATFIPEIDACFAEIMVEMSREIRTKPWAMDVLRLHFMLSDGTPLGQEVLESLGSARIFDLLLVIGGSRKVREDKITELISPSVTKVQLSHHAKIVPTLMQVLASHQLVYVAESTTRSARNLNHWSLTSAGEDLTSAAFAANFSITATTSAEDLQPLAPGYQSAVLRKWPANLAPSLRDLLLSNDAFLSRRGLETAANVVATLCTRDDALRVFSCWLNEDQPTSTRSAALQAAGTLADAREIGQLLLEVAQSGAAEKLRETALESLLDAQLRTGTRTPTDSVRRIIATF